MRSSLHWLAAAAWLAGCAGDRTEPVALGSAAIIGGEQDDDHDAVALVRLSWGRCTGTLVHVDDAGDGYIATAAHCIEHGGEPTRVVFGDDYTDADALSFEVLEWAQHEGYVPEIRDVAAIRLDGSPAGIAPVRLLAPEQDGLSDGQRVRTVGYGAVDEAGTSSTQRKIATGTISFLRFNEVTVTGDDGEPCPGDSGGPLLVTGDDGPRVAGVLSTTSTGPEREGCKRGRDHNYERAAYYRGFFDRFIHDDSGGCSYCLQSRFADCADARRECFEERECMEYGDCIKACFGDPECENECVRRNPDGAETYGRTVGRCYCDSVCPRECTEQCTGALAGRRVDGAAGPDGGPATRDAGTATGDGGPSTPDGGVGADAATERDADAPRTTRTGGSGGCAVDRDGQPVSGLWLLLLVAGIRRDRRRKRSASDGCVSS